MERLRFYLYYSLRRMWREKWRTAFALFCVAAGVAAIVGLQTLGSLVADELTGDAQAANRGDVAVGPAYGWFSEEQMAAFEQLASDELVTAWTQCRFQDGLTISLSRDEGPETVFLLSAFLVDPDVYPFYGQVLALDPAGASLAELLVEPDDTVVSKNLADRLDIAIGDQLRFEGWSTLYTVRGVVPTGSAASIKNIVPLANGFFYLEYDATVNAWGRDWTASEVFFTTEDEAGAAAVAAKAAQIAPLSPVHTVAGRLEQNKRTARLVNRFMLIVGLLAMLVGGIGIANTMQVVVARRRLEIAVLKAVGLKGRHVTWLFLSEAVLLGLGGGLAGLLLGLGGSRGLVGLTQTFLSNPVHWRIYLQPLVIGPGLGIVTTVIFGFLPTLAAAHIRPSQVLRPASGELPRVGCGQSLLAVMVLTGVLGVLAGQLLGSRVGGLMSAFGVLILLTVLTGLLRIVVWLIEKVPSLGWVSLRLAQRGLGRNRGRAASTLLALIVGLFSISLIVILAANVLSNLRKIADEALGADLLIWIRDKATLEAALQTLETSQEVQSFVQVSGFEAELTAINGDPGARERRIAAYEREQGTLLAPQSRENLDERLAAIMGHDLSANLPHFAIEPGMGRNLTPDDRRRPVALVMNSQFMAPLKLQPGETLTFRLEGDEQITLEIIGVVKEENIGFQNNAVIAPLDTLMAQATPRSYSLRVDMHPHRKDEAVTALRRSLPEGTFVIETDAILSTYNRVLQQVTVLPILVAAVALFAAATMIANTTALSVIERRREIGVMKAVGIKGRRILGQLLLESSIIGLVGGLISIGLVMLPLTLFSEELGWLSGVNPWPILKLLALAVGVSLAATLVTAWPASRRRPLEVLRNE